MDRRNLRDTQKFQEYWWDWTFLNPAFDYGIRVSDLDGIVERHGQFLVLEGKRLVGESPAHPLIPLGQQRLHDALCSSGTFEVAVLWGVPPNGPIRRFRWQTADDERTVDATADHPDLRPAVLEAVRRWFLRADAEASPLQAYARAIQRGVRQRAAATTPVDLAALRILESECRRARQTAVRASRSPPRQTALWDP